MDKLCFDVTTFVIGVILIALLVWKLNKDGDEKRIEIMNRINSSAHQLDAIAQQRGYQRVAEQTMSVDQVVSRDRAVISDPLYPALGRTERPIFDNIQQHNFNYATRDTADTYRLLGYLVNKTTEDLGSNVWQLFGRQKYRGSSMGEFYVIPSHTDKKNMKVQLDDSMFVGDKIRDIYALPNKVRLNSPFFSNDEYDLIQLPKTDFTSHYI
jgi:hypothetical protein